MPMDRATWHLLGAGAMLLSFVVITYRADIRREIGDSPVLRVVGGAASVYLWAWWGIQAFAVEIVTETGSTVISNNPGLGVFGFAAAMIMAIDLLQSVFELLNQETTNAQESNQRTA